MAAVAVSMERAHLTDPKTGTDIWQLTSFPYLHAKFYMHVDQFSGDGNSIVFFGNRSLDRDSGSDIFMCDINGENLLRLTDGVSIGRACTDPLGQYVYYTTRDGILRRISLKSYESEDLARCDFAYGFGGTPSVSKDGRYYITHSSLNDGSNAVIVFCTETGEARVVYRALDHNHLKVSHTQLDPSGSGYIAFQHDWPELCCGISAISLDGSDLRRNLVMESNGHWGWLGTTGKLFTNCIDNHHRMAVADFNTGERRVVVRGDHFFWHGGCSRDGKWLVSDTNWPNEGIYIINIETGKHSLVCVPGNSGAGAQNTHAHPSFSPDGRHIAYQSDVTGTTQIYIATLSDTLLGKLSNGGGVSR